MTDAAESTQARTGAGAVASYVLTAAQAVAAFSVLFLMCNTLANVFMRYGFASPVRGTSEIVANWYMPLIAFSGFVFAQAQDRHIAANLLYDRMPPRPQYEIALFGMALTTLVSALFAWFTLQEALHSYAINRRVISGHLWIVTWPATFTAPLAFGIMTVLTGFSLARLVRAGYPAGRPAGLPMRDWLVRLLCVAGIGGSTAAIFLLPAREWQAVAALVLMVSLLFLKMPVAFVLALPGLIGIYAIRPRALFTMLEAQPYETSATWTLSVLPMFVLMGLLLWKSGLTTSIYVAARHWLSWMPGGLAVSTNIAGTGFAAVSGSTFATTYALGRIGVPEMLRAGYDRRVAVGAVMVAGLPGQLIPPSTFLVIYAGIAEVPVGPQLMAGVGPGLLVAAVFTVALILFGMLRPSAVGWTEGRGAAEASSWGDRWRSLGQVWPLPVLIGIVLGGMYSGVLTATEAGAAGAAAALVLTLFSLRVAAWRAILDAAVETVIVTGAIFMLLLGAEILSAMLTLTGLTYGFTDWVSTMEFSRFQFLLIVMVAYLVLGTFMEPLPIILLTVPLLVPSFAELGISPLWFGVFAVFMGELGILTPPVGILAFVLHSVVQDKAVNLGQRITLGDIFAAVSYFMPVAILAAILLILFPETATWLPDQMAR